MIPFGQWVRLHREHKGLRQFQLALLAGLDRSTLNVLETRGRGAQIETLIKIAKALGLAPWEALFLMEKCDAEDYRPDEV